MTQEFLIYGAAMTAASAAAVACYPAIAGFWEHASSRVEGFQQGKVERATRALDDIFVDVKPKWLKVAYGLGPLGCGLLFYILFNNLFLVAVGAVLGVVLPDVWVRQTRAMRKGAFRAQLVDALFVLSSSLRAGLSLTQAFEMLEQELSPPASQEFGLIVKSQRVGGTLDDALRNLNRRMACEEMQLITTAILVTRETGGDVTGIIGQLVSTIREKKKLLDKVSTLTLQGRLQAYIMSGLPIVFALSVRSFNPGYFSVMTQDRTGVMLCAAAVGLWVIGMFLLMKLSKVAV